MANTSLCRPVFLLQFFSW
uniref:Uncharacterized protein n=1 Tax=Arundo donax TaxID=35708 RepID=A0A0A9EDY6_ARUDO